MPFLHLAVLVGIYLILPAAAASTGLCRGGTGAAIEGSGIGKILTCVQFPRQKEIVTQMQSFQSYFSQNYKKNSFRISFWFNSTAGAPVVMTV